jgi:GNAT superfamily N-acetyltransferase
MLAAESPGVRDAGPLGDIRFAWRVDVTDDELVTLTQSHGGTAPAGWWDRIHPYSLGWVTARMNDGTLVGFVNVAWDGGDHAFLIDTKVRLDHQRHGIGTELVRIASRQAKEAGCEWMEVDFDEHLAPFYLRGLRVRSDPAGLLHRSSCRQPLLSLARRFRGGRSKQRLVPY